MLDTVRSKLHTVDEVLESLRYTDSLIAVGDRMSEGKFEFVKDGENYRMLVNDTSSPFAEDYTLDYASVLNAARLVGISEGYAGKFPEEDSELLLSHINYWFSKKNRPFSALIDPGTHRVKAFTANMREENEIQSQSEQLQLVIEALRGLGVDGEILCHGDFNSLNKGFHVGLVFEKQNVEAKPGDIILGGIHFTDSRLGLLKPEISSYTLRLACTNGAMSIAEEGRIIRTGEDWKMTTRQWLETSTARAYDQLPVEFHNIKGLVGTQVGDHGVHFAESLFEHNAVPKEKRLQMLADIREAGDLYDVFNIFTAEAQNPELSGEPEKQEMFMRLGGHVVSHRDFCPHCHSELKISA